MNHKKTVTGFSVIPYSLMDAIQDVDVWGVYGCVYRHGHNSEQGCWTSVKTLHEETGLSIKLVQRSLAWLVENRWLTAQVRVGYTTVYHVTPLAPVQNSSTTPIEINSAVENDCTSSVETDGTPQAKTTAPPSRKRLTNQNPLTKTQEPKPINKRDASAASKDLNRLKKLNSAVIPMDLSDCSDLLTEYWSEKKGVRSTPVLNRLCNTLRKMTPKQRQEALEAAISGGWANIYPPKPQAGSSGTKGGIDWDALDNVSFFPNS